MNTTLIHCPKCKKKTKHMRLRGSGNFKCLKCKHCHKTNIFVSQAPSIYYLRGEKRYVPKQVNTLEFLQKVQQLYNDFLPITEIAKQLNTSVSTIYKILNERGYKDARKNRTNIE